MFLYTIANKLPPSPQSSPVKGEAEKLSPSPQSSPVKGEEDFPFLYTASNKSLKFSPERPLLSPLFTDPRFWERGESISADAAVSEAILTSLRFI